MLPRYVLIVFRSKCFPFAQTQLYVFHILPYFFPFSPALWRSVSRHVPLRICFELSIVITRSPLVHLKKCWCHSMASLLAPLHFCLSESSCRIFELKRRDKKNNTDGRNLSLLYFSICLLDFFCTSLKRSKSPTFSR